MNLQPFIIIITAALVLLWAYASLTKLYKFKQFKKEMMIQIFPAWINRLNIYLVPLIELVIMVLLLVPKTRLLGMYASAILMGLFTLYVGGAVFHLYKRVPCACGGIFKNMGWSKHFKINILLTVVALAGVILMEY